MVLDGGGGVLTLVGREGDGVIGGGGGGALVAVKL